MSDIVDRLNDSLSAGYSELRKEAAQEILQLRKERDELRAKIEAMERQEPVAWARKLAMGLPSFGCVTDLKYRPSNMPESAYMQLYALPGAQPAPIEMSITTGALSEMFLSLDGHDNAQPGYEWRKG